MNEGLHSGRECHGEKTKEAEKRNTISFAEGRKRRVRRTREVVQDK